MSDKAAPLSADRVEPVVGHLCDSCEKEFETCDAKRIVFGIDRDPSLRGAEADKVLECDALVPNSVLDREK